jgi:hypothetical protein
VGPTARIAMVIAPAEAIADFDIRNLRVLLS